MKRPALAILLLLAPLAVACGSKESTAQKEDGKTSALCREVGGALDGVVILEAKDTGTGPSIMDAIAKELEAECTAQKAEEKSKAALECYSAHAKEMGYRMFKSCPQEPAKALVAAVVAKHGGPKEGPAPIWPSMSGAPAASVAAPPAPASATASATSSATASPAPVGGPQFKVTLSGVEKIAPLVELNLGDGGMPDFALTAPEGASVRKAALGVELSASSVNYSISVRPAAFAPATAKQNFASLDPKGKLVTDSPDLVLFQRENGALLFSMGVAVGDEKLTCATVATATDFDRAMVDQMIASCRTLKRVSAAPAAPTVASNGNPGGAPTGKAPPPPKPTVAKPECKCAKGDLMCNMRCAGKR